MSRGVVGVFKSLQRACRPIGANVAVLVEVVAIERARTASNVPIHALIRHEFAVGLDQSRIQRVKRSAEGFRRAQALLRPFAVQKPEQLVLDNRASQIAAKLLPLKWRSSGTGQVGCDLVPAEKSERLAVHRVRAR